MSKKKITIGCENQDNLVAFLKEDFNVVTPYISYKNGELITNFDYYFIFDTSSLNAWQLNHLGIPNFGASRLGKFDQSLVLSTLKIRHPKQYVMVLGCDNTTRLDDYFLLTKHLSDDTQILLKSNNGARGIGQILLPKGDLYKLFDMVNKGDCDVEDVIKNFNTGGEGLDEDEKKFIKSTITGCDFTLQELEEIETEFRFVYFYGQEPIIINRPRVDSTWQANTSVTGKGITEEYNPNNTTHSEMLEIAQKLADEEGAPFLSIDFYIADGKIGVLEYQMQMGYKIINKTELVEKTINSIKAYIKEKV